MAAKPIPNEIFQRILEVLSLKEFARPWAVLLDDGDLGNVFTYMPLSSEEFKALDQSLQSHVYVIAPGRYGLIGQIPKKFEPAEDADVTGVTVVYNAWNSIVEMSYSLEGRPQTFLVKHPMRRDALLEYAKKKKIPIKTIIRS